jgi:hypothetical protein
MKLNTTALEKNTSTPVLKITHLGKLSVCYEGDLDNETLTMEASMDFVNWATCYPGDDASVAETYTNAAAGVRPRVLLLPEALYVRWTMSNGAGTPADVYVHVGGECGKIVTAA